MFENVAFCDAVLLTEEGLAIEGWAASASIPCSGLTPSVNVNGAPVDFTVSYFDRPDVRQVTNLPDEAPGYRFLLDVRHIYEQSKTALEVSFSDGLSRWPATMRPHTNHASELDFLSKEDFLRRFQNPAFRTKNKIHQVYAACKALTQFRDDEYVKAAAYCLCVYRYEDLPEMVGRLGVLEQAAAFYDHLADDGSGLFVRWKTSLSTAFGLHFVRLGNFERAYYYFSQITEIRDAERRWPQMLFSRLSALLFCGWHLHRSGDRLGAIAIVSRYGDLFKTAIADMRFDNWYVFEELQNANRAAQQCAVMLAICSGAALEEFAVPEESRKVAFGRLNADWRRVTQLRPELDQA